MNRTRLMLLHAATLTTVVGCSDRAATSVAAPAPEEAVASFRDVVRGVEERAKSPRTHLIARKAPGPHYKAEHRVIGTPKWAVRGTGSPATPYEADVEFTLRSRKYPDSDSADEATSRPTPEIERQLEIRAKYVFRENAWVLEKRHKGLWPLDDTPFVHKEYEWIRVIP